MIAFLWGTYSIVSCYHHFFSLCLSSCRLNEDLYSLVKKDLEELQEKGSLLRIAYKWDFNDHEDRWWW